MVLVLSVIRLSILFTSILGLSLQLSAKTILAFCRTKAKAVLSSRQGRSCEFAVIHGGGGAAHGELGVIIRPNDAQFATREADGHVAIQQTTLNTNSDSHAGTGAAS